MCMCGEKIPACSEWTPWFLYVLNVAVDGRYGLLVKSLPHIKKMSYNHLRRKRFPNRRTTQRSSHTKATLPLSQHISLIACLSKAQNFNRNKSVSKINYITVQHTRKNHLPGITNDRPFLGESSCAERRRTWLVANYQALKNISMALSSIYQSTSFIAKGYNFDLRNASLSFASLFSIEQWEGTWEVLSCLHQDRKWVRESTVPLSTIAKWLTASECKIQHSDFVLLQNMQTKWRVILYGIPQNSDFYR